MFSISSETDKEEELGNISCVSESTSTDIILQLPLDQACIPEQPNLLLGGKIAFSSGGDHSLVIASSIVFSPEHTPPQISFSLYELHIECHIMAGPITSRTIDPVKFLPE